MPVFKGICCREANDFKPEGLKQQAFIIAQFRWGLLPGCSHVQARGGEGLPPPFLMLLLAGLGPPWLLARPPSFATWASL